MALFSNISTNNLNEYLYNSPFLTNEMQLIPFESMAIVAPVLYKYVDYTIY